MSVLPFEDIRALTAGLPPMAEPKLRADPALGRLGELAAWLSCWRAGPGAPRIHRPILALYAGSHQVAQHSRAAGNPDTVRARLGTVAAGGVAANALALGQGAGVEAFDLAIDRPVPDIAEHPAMSEREAAATMAFGMEALAKQPDLLLLGEITAGGAIAAAAIALVLYGGEAEEWTEQDAGVVAQAAARTRALMGRSSDPLEVLRQLGGRETAALAGAILAARMQGVPVILGGYGPIVAAAVLHRLDPRTLDHVLVGDICGSVGCRAVIEELGLEPLTRYGVTAEDGVAALAALPVLKMACDAVQLTVPAP